MNILILGANGQVGWELRYSLKSVGVIKAYDRCIADFENLDNLRTVVRRCQPDVIVNAAAYTAVDKAESEPERAKLVNTDAVSLLAEEAESLHTLLVHYSTDYVFNGTKTTPYIESDRAEPINVYGITKWQGEEAIRKSGCSYLIFRTSWVYACRRRNFIMTLLNLAAKRDEVSVVADQFGAPTHARLIADVTSVALQRHLRVKAKHSVSPHETYHLSAAGETSWYEYACFVLDVAEQNSVGLKVNQTKIKPVSSEAYPMIANRPKNSRLSCEKIESAFNLQLPDWRKHIRFTIRELISQGIVE